MNAHFPLQNGTLTWIERVMERQIDAHAFAHSVTTGHRRTERVRTALSNPHHFLGPFVHAYPVVWAGPLANLVVSQEFRDHGLQSRYVSPYGTGSQSYAYFLLDLGLQLMELCLKPKSVPPPSSFHAPLVLHTSSAMPRVVVPRSSTKIPHCGS
jgi:hypothetical protein